MRQRGVDVDGCQGVNEQKAAELMWLAVSPRRDILLTMSR